MNKYLWLALPLASALSACGAQIGKDGAEEGTAGSVSDPMEFHEEATVCPGSNKVYGIDVSYYQGTINWASVKAAGKQFAIIRVSDGTGFLDPKFASNWRNAKAAGIAVGAYQFFRPNQDATAQAELGLLANGVGDSLTASASAPAICRRSSMSRSPAESRTARSLRASTRG